jgi:hypothetical protein
VSPKLVLTSVADNERLARAGLPKTAVVGVVAVSLALLLAACGGSPQAGVASLGNATTTTTAPSALAGTGGGGGVAANAGSGAPAGGPHTVMVMSKGNGANMLKFAQCMRSHGVLNFPDPSSNGTVSISGSEGGTPQFQAADTTCRKLLPNGGIPTAEQQAQGIAQLLKFSECMRAHRISDYPDPTSNGIRIPVPKNPGSDLNPNNPRLQSAEKACQSLAPG